MSDSANMPICEYDKWGSVSMRSLPVQLGIVVASLVVTFMLNKFFNVNAFFLVIPFIFPFTWGFNRKGGRDD